MLPPSQPMTSLSEATWPPLVCSYLQGRLASRATEAAHLHGTVEALKLQLSAASSRLQRQLSQAHPPLAHRQQPHHQPHSHHSHHSHSQDSHSHNHSQDSHDHSQDSHDHSHNHHSHNHSQDSHDHSQDSHDHSQDSHDHSQDSHTLTSSASPRPAAYPATPTANAIATAPSTATAPASAYPAPFPSTATGSTAAAPVEPWLLIPRSLGLGLGLGIRQPQAPSQGHSAASCPLSHAGLGPAKPDTAAHGGALRGPRPAFGSTEGDSPQTGAGSSSSGGGGGSWASTSPSAAAASIASPRPFSASVAVPGAPAHPQHLGAAATIRPSSALSSRSSHTQRHPRSAASHSTHAAAAPLAAPRLGATTPSLADSHNIVLLEQVHSQPPANKGKTSSSAPSLLSFLQTADQHLPVNLAPPAGSFLCNTHAQHAPASNSSSSSSSRSFHPSLVSKSYSLGSGLPSFWGAAVSPTDIDEPPQQRSAQRCTRTAWPPTAPPTPTGAAMQRRHSAPPPPL
ncbi:MAG: hypothetical protein WDW38_007183 [Sanguina aurantia]